MILVYLGCAWLVGLALGQRLLLAQAGPLLALSLLLFAAIAAARLLPGLPHRPWLASLCLVLALAALAYANLRRPSAGPDPMSQYAAGSAVELMGVVDGDPEPRPASARLTIAVRAVKTPAGEAPLSARILVYAAREESYRYGDLVTLSGRLEGAVEGLGDTYAAELSHEGIAYVMSHPRLTIVARGQGFPPRQWLASLRARLAGVLAAALPEPQASLAQGILLGLRGTIPADLADAFRQTGTTHILAISGQNLTIIAGMLLTVGARLLGRRRAILAAFVAIWIYAFLTGVPASVVRAAIMVSAVFLAGLAGRQNHGPVALSLAAALMSVVQPDILEDVGFQLSALAMLGLLVLTPPLQRIVQRALPEARIGGASLRLVGDALAVSLGASLATAPAIGFHFGATALIGPLATMLALPALPLIMVAAALTAVIGLLAPALATAAGWVAWLPLTYLWGVVGVAARIPGRSLPSGPGTPEALALAYACVVAIAWLLHRVAGPAWTAPSPRWRLPVSGRVLVLGIVAAASLGLAFVQRPDQRFHLWLLDVGQGDAILVQTPSGRQVLIDGGPPDGSVLRQLGRRLPFWDRSLDLVIATHPDGDHIGGLLDILQRYQVGQAVDNGFQADTGVARRWRAESDERAVPTHQVTAGTSIDLGDGIQLLALNPPAAAPPGAADNDLALAFRLTGPGFRVILPADLGPTALQSLIDGKTLEAADVLVLPHHGARNALLPEVVQRVRPQVALLSVGRDNRYGHPHPDSLAAVGATPLFRTDRNGTVELVETGGPLQVRVERP